MAVEVTWSLTNGGSAISDPIDHGGIDAGAEGSASEIFLRHNGGNVITNCGFYLTNTDPNLDLPVMIAWGDGITAASFGGFELNMNAVGGYPTWPSYTNKYGTNYNVFRTGAGDTRNNAITLATNMGLSSGAGIIQTGSAPNVRFKCRIVVPSSYSNFGPILTFSQKLRFTYTS